MRLDGGEREIMNDFRGHSRRLGPPSFWFFRLRLRTACLGASSMEWQSSPTAQHPECGVLCDVAPRPA